MSFKQPPCSRQLEAPPRLSEKKRTDRLGGEREKGSVPTLDRFNADVILRLIWSPTQRPPTNREINGVRPDKRLSGNEGRGERWTAGTAGGWVETKKNAQPRRNHTPPSSSAMETTKERKQWDFGNNPISTKCRGDMPE